MKPVDLAKNILGEKRALNPSGLYSKAEEVARDLPQKRGNVDQMLAMMANQGVKPAEMLNAGRPFGDSISKEELARHFGDKKPKIKVTKYHEDREDEDGIPAQYADYKTPGGRNYREHLLHVPSRSPEELKFRMHRDADGGINVKKKVPFGDYQSPHWNAVPNVLAHVRMSDFYSPVDEEAWRESNNTLLKALRERNIAHKHYVNADRELREVDREGRFTKNHFVDKEKAYKDFEEKARAAVNAKSRLKALPMSKVLRLEELQSDWGQEGRKKGFYNHEKPHKVIAWGEGKDDASLGDFSSLEEAQKFAESVRDQHGDGLSIRTYAPGATGDSVPEAPFVTNTQHWTDLGLKHVLNEAAKGNYDKLSWVSGDDQNDRYGLEKHLDSISYAPELGAFRSYRPDGNAAHHDDIGDDEVKELIGEELYNKLMTTPKDEMGYHNISGANLKVGGGGMRKYYDEILPRSLLKIAKQHDPDAKIIPHKMGTGSNQIDTQVLDITPRMRESILKGQTLFKRGGAARFADGGAVDPNPTNAQKEAGNYRKEHVSFQGLPVSIENKKGSYRSGIAPNGRHWSVKMPYDYGYVKGTEGADGDHVDVCIGPDADSDSVFVVDQKNLNTGKFDEHKAMLGYSSLIDAEKAYISGFSDGKGHLRMGPVIRMTVAEFKKWVKTNGTKIANKKQSLVDDALKLIRR